SSRLTRLAAADPSLTRRQRLDGVATAHQLGLEEADLAHDFPVEIALAHPALRLDEAQIDIEAEQPFDLLAYAVRQLAADDGAARFDEGAHLADELGSRGAQLLHGGDLLLDGLEVVLRAL